MAPTKLLHKIMNIVTFCALNFINMLIDFPHVKYYDRFSDAKSLAKRFEDKDESQVEI